MAAPKSDRVMSMINNVAMFGATLRSVFILCLLIVPILSEANREGESLHAWKRSLVDPAKVLDTWDPKTVHPCGWGRITCTSKYYIAGVHLGHSFLSGELTDSHVGGLTNLRVLDLHNNNISGSIPSWLGNLTQLVSLDLSENHFTGPIPSSFGQLQNLQYLELYSNNLSGSIPSSLGNLTQLISLDLYENDLNGSIPTSLGALQNLQYLRLDHNDLTGVIPSVLTTIASLLVVDLSYNNLSGIAPRFASSVNVSLQGNPNLIVS